ncbi:MAG: 3-hydroxybutyryl-CoA dehydrogenase [Firmicutes bacterium]|jgi:3-hydroxybutyryl-CoA dehydrogenase|nr:3-hydroxyacyl-CoA dehydrogenase NAD-binding domain-containing protein [Bacillota bacterium]NLO66318.1 3-hydroxybutyryl-CoA dehydrogenase [Bacillota bacterium]
MIIGVIGAGTMGSGIAEIAAQQGQVVMLDVAMTRAEAGLQAIDRRLSRGVERGYVDEVQKEQILANITLSTELRDLAEADIVLEAAAEDLEIKKELFVSLAEICSEQCILATNTSALSVTAIAAAVKNPARVLGIHFFNPVPRMKLVELVKTPFAEQEYLAKAREFVEALGKTAVLVDESPGFVVNRLLIPMINEAVYLLQEGVASAEDIDTAMQLGANHPMGPLALADLVGLDICLAIMETLQRELGEDKYRPAPLLRKMVRAGKLGRKTKAGFYHYN